MEKRKAFYVSTDIFEKGLSNSAISVLAYLSFCANREGICFPSLRRISDKCGICKNTVIKAIKELVDSGVISCRPRIERTDSGLRQTSNVYRLLAPRGERKPRPKQAGEESSSEPAPNASAPEANAFVTVPKASVPEANAVVTMPNASVPAANAFATVPKASAPSPTACVQAQAYPGGRIAARSIFDDPAFGPECLLKRLDISGLYDNKQAAKAIEIAIKEMWYTENFRFKGERIPRRLVRERLFELDIDAVDLIMSKLGSAEDAVNKAAYLKALIYDAPLQINALIGHDIAALM